MCFLFKMIFSKLDKSVYFAILNLHNPLLSNIFRCAFHHFFSAIHDLILEHVYNILHTGHLPGIPRAFPFNKNITPHGWHSGCLFSPYLLTVCSYEVTVTQLKHLNVLNSYSRNKRWLACVCLFGGLPVLPLHRKWLLRISLIRSPHTIPSCSPSYRTLTISLSLSKAMKA